MMLILVCGLQGTGKTTVAKRIAEDTKSVLLSTDMIRKGILEEPGYTEKEREMIYNLLFEMAEKLLSSGNSVVLDGTFYRKKLRDRVKKIAKKAKSDFHMVEVKCSEEIIRKRMKERKKEETGSDADFEVYRKAKKQFEPIREKHVVIRTEKGDWGPVEEFLKTI